MTHDKHVLTRTAHSSACADTHVGLRAAVVLSLASSLLAAQVHASQMIWSGQVATVSLPAPTYGRPASPQIAVDPDSNAVLVWMQPGPQELDALFVVQAARYDATARAWGPVTTLSAPAPEFDSLVRVVAGRGSAAALWLRFDGTHAIVQASRYVAASNQWTPAQTLSAPGAHSGDLQLAMDSVGNVLAGWTRYGTPYVVQAARFSVASGTWTAAADLAPAGGGLRFVVDRDGNTVAVWSGTSAIQSASYAASAEAWTAPVDLPATGDLTPDPPQLVVDEAGTVSCTWTSYVTGRSAILVSRRSSATGVWSSPNTLSSPDGDAHSQQLVVDLAGNVVVTWLSGSLNVNPMIVTVLEVARYDAAAGVWSAAQVLSKPGARDVQLVVDGDGYVTSVWSQYSGLWPLQNAVVQSSRYSPPEKAWSAPVNLTSQSNEYLDLRLVAGPTGNVMVLWVRHGIESTSFDPAIGAWSGPVRVSPDAVNAGEQTIAFTPTGEAIGAWWAWAAGYEAFGAVQSTRWFPGDPPAAPAGLAVRQIDANVVTITWNPAGNGVPATGFVLEGGVNPGEVLASIPTNSTTPTFTFAAPSGAFYIRVHAVAGPLRSPPSNEIQIFVNVPVAPSPPSDLRGLVNGTDIALSWTNTFAGGAPTSLWLNVAGAITATLPLPIGEAFAYANVPPGTYTLSVVAANASGVSAPSNEVTLTFPGLCSGVPAAPTKLQTWKVGTTIFLLWDPPASGPAVTSYTVAVTGAYSGYFETTGRTLSGAAAPGSYTVSVTARNVCGVGSRTPEQTVEIP
jgi:hypothetical protein